jgi:hypothetical protein
MGARNGDAPTASQDRASASSASAGAGFPGLLWPAEAHPAQVLRTSLGLVSA